MNNVKSGFFTINRFLGRKNKDSPSYSRSSSNLSQSMLNLNGSSQNLSVLNNDENRISPLNMNNAPFEQTFRITVSLPRGQLYVARLGAKTQLCVLLKMICDDKQLDENLWVFCHPTDNSQIYHKEMTIGLVGLSELRLVNASEIMNSDNDSLFSSSDIDRIRNDRRNSYVSPYSSTNSLNSIDSAGINHHHHNNIHPAVPVRKKRMAPRPPSQNSNNNFNHVNNSNLKNEINGNVAVNGGDNKFKNQSINQKKFHVSSPNLANSNHYLLHKIDLNDNDNNNNNNYYNNDNNNNNEHTTHYNSVNDLRQTDVVKNVKARPLSMAENSSRTIIGMENIKNIPEPIPRRRITSGAKKKVPAPQPRGLPPVPLPRIAQETSDEQISSSLNNTSHEGPPSLTRTRSPSPVIEEHEELIEENHTEIKRINGLNTTIVEENNYPIETNIVIESNTNKVDDIPKEIEVKSVEVNVKEDIIVDNDKNVNDKLNQRKESIESVIEEETIVILNKESEVPNKSSPIEEVENSNKIIEKSNPQIRSSSPLWTYTLPAPPNFADNKEKSYTDIATINDSTINSDIISEISKEENSSHMSDACTESISSINTTSIVEYKNFDNEDLKDSGVDCDEIVIENKINDFKLNKSKSQNDDCIKNEKTLTKALTDHEIIENSKNHVIEELNTVLHNGNVNNIENNENKIILTNGNKDEFKIPENPDKYKNLKSKRHIYRSSSFHSTQFNQIDLNKNGNENGILNENGISKDDNVLNQLPRRKSAGELSLSASPSLQSIEVLKMILPTLNLKSSDKKIKEIKEIDKLEKTEIKVENKKVESKYKYRGPPAIQFSSWSERPKTQVSIKSDSDYKTSENINSTVKENETTVQNNIRSDINESDNKKTVEKTVRLPIIRMVEYKKTAFIPEEIKKSQEIYIASKSNLYTTFSRPQTMYEDFSKPEINSSSIQSDIQLKNSKNYNGVSNTNVFTKFSGNNNNNNKINNKFTPVVRGFKMNNEYINNSENNEINSNKSLKSNRHSSYEPGSIYLENNENGLKDINLIPSQQNLRRTSIKEKILNNDINNKQINLNLDTEKNLIKSNQNQQIKIINNKNVLIENHNSVNPPPPPPPVINLPKLKPVQKEKNIKINNCINPRDQLLSAIRNFNRGSLKKN